ncbi:hypothetical protein HBI81_249620 [Parastagonospora nodorum]|nr:hypothetical protein HBI23_234110 [Parastagonospora nodorum]KAH5707309.1 hypothetical protein HBI18_250230 [Parastagonospora nodorum]KAH6510927.1 hypothetical protein HBI81_249620 [Parastagonospora nodorum]
MSDAASSSATNPHLPSLPYLTLLSVLEQAIFLATDDDGNVDMEQFRSLSNATVGLKEASSRYTIDTKDYKGKTGRYILEELEYLMLRQAVTLFTRPKAESIRTMSFDDLDGVMTYTDVTPDPGGQPARRALINSLFRPASDPACLRELPGMSVEEELDYASGLRGHIIGQAFIIAILCTRLVHLELKLKCSTGPAAPSDAFRLLSLVFATDAARGTTTWPNLKQLTVSKDDGEVCTLPIPPYVHDVTIIGATDGCITITDPSVSNLRRLRLEAHSSTSSGEACEMAEKLIRAGLLPNLTAIEIVEFSLNADSARSFVLACQAHLPALEALIVDVAWRHDDYANTEGMNDHLMNLAPLGPELFAPFKKLVRLEITRFLVGDIMGIGRYLTQNLEHFNILGAFGEELHQVANGGPITMPKRWAGSLIFGIDYCEESDASNLIDLAEQAFDTAIRAATHNIEHKCASNFNVQLRATGNLCQPRPTMFYFE